MADPAGGSGPLAVVVGAGGGIGAACAQALARTGHGVVCVDRDRDRAAATAAAVDAGGGWALPVAADAEADGFGPAVLAELPAQSRVAAAVHAVAFEEHRRAEDVEEGSLLRSYRIGPLAAFSLFRALAVSGRCVDGPAFTVISSLHRDHAFRGCLGYNAAHAALVQIVRTLAHEWAGRRIRVNGVAPGWIATPGEEALYGRDHLDQVGRQLPFGDFGRPDQVAAAVAFLSSPAADYVSGSVLTVDGALSASLARLPGEPA